MTAALRLAVGEAVDGIPIRAGERWNAAGIRVEAGERYRVRADGEWIDGGIPCDADGFTSDAAPPASRWLLRASERWRRMPPARWFQLVAAIGPSGASRPGDVVLSALGRDVEWTAPASGDVWCFANDVALMYWNNRGTVRLDVRRIA